MSQSEGPKKVLTATDPAGTSYRIVTAPHGTPLREWSMAIDVYSFLLELLLGLLPSRKSKGAQQFKIGVFIVNPRGYERCVHKASHIAGETQVRAAAAELLGEIERGNFTPR